MPTPPFEIPSFVPEAPGLDMVNEINPHQRIPAESSAWVRYEDVLDLIMIVRQREREAAKP